MEAKYIFFEQDLVFAQNILQSLCIPCIYVKIMKNNVSYLTNTKYNLTFNKLNIILRYKRNSIKYIIRK